MLPNLHTGFSEGRSAGLIFPSLEEFSSLLWSMQSKAFSSVQSLSCFQLFVIPWDCSPPGSSVHGILLARILEWVATHSLQGIFLTQGSNLHLFISCIGRWVLYHYHYLESPSPQEWIKDSKVVPWGEISITSNTHMTPPLRQKAKKK